MLCFTEENFAHGDATILANILITNELVDINEQGLLHFVSTVVSDPSTGLTAQQLAAIDYLISKGVEVDQVAQAFYGFFGIDDRDEGPITALAAATRQANFPVVKHLLDRCADPEKAKGGGKSAMDVAMEIGWERGVQLFDDWNKGWRGKELGTQGYRPDWNIDGIPPSRRNLRVTALDHVGKESGRKVLTIRQNLKPSVEFPLEKSMQQEEDDDDSES